MLSTSSHDIKTILLVEDDEMVRSVLHQTLNIFGFIVLEAAGSAEAHDVCDRYDNVIQLAIIDVSIEQTSGVEIGEALTAQNPAMKLIYMSGYLGADLFESGVLDQDAYFLQKPINPSELLAKLERLLGPLHHRK
jgi:DNA-binding NtrC family response regulator